MKKTLLFLLFFLQFFTIFAQNPANIEHTFGAFPGFDGVINSTVIQADGKIIIGGDFTNYQGVSANRIIRINSDGSKDDSFIVGTAFNNTIYSIALQSDGKIIISGDFTSYQGITTNRIIRLNSDGSKDTSFNIGTGINGTIFSLLIQTDGKIMVGGGFTTYQGAAANRIIRLNNDGSKDTSFNLLTGFNSTIKSMALQSDGKIVLGGNFTSYQNNSQNYIIRLNIDGSKDVSFNSGTGFDNSILSIIIQPDEKIILGGNFTSFQGNNINRIIRLNSDGSNDSSFNSGSGFDNSINSMILQTNGKIILGGAFLTYQGTTVNRIICLNNDGSKDSSFNSGIGFDNTINSILIQTDGKIILSGAFTNYKNSIENHIIRLNTDANKDSSFNTGKGFNNNVITTAIQADGKIIVGGAFTSYNGINENKIIRLNNDGIKDASFNTETGFQGGGISSIKLQANGKIIAFGDFTSYKGVSENKIIRLNTDGSKDTSFNIGTGFNGKIYSLALQTDGKLVIGGDFTSYQGVTANRIIRLNSDGSIDTSFNTGTGFTMSFNLGTVVKVTIYSIAVQQDGKIILGGIFDLYKGKTAISIIRLNSDGTPDSSFDTTTGGFDNEPSYIALQDNGKILVCGRFSTYKGITAKYIIRLNPDSTIDTSFNSGTGLSSTPSTIVPQVDGKIILGGGFVIYQGVSEKYIIRLNSDGSKDTSFNTGTGFDGSVASISVQPDGKIILSGRFNSYQGNNSSSYLIRLKGNYVVNPLVSNATQTNVICPGSATGSASVTVSGGKSPYSYLWSNGETTSTISGLTAGSYSCKITDSDLTSITENFNIITETDNQNPTITAPANVTVNTTSNCTAIGVLLETPLTADNCTISSVTNDAPAVFPVGSTTIIWTVKDANNNIATATQIVTVKDITPPTITAPSAVTVNTTLNCTATGVVLGTPVTSDNCTISSVTNNAPSSFPIGNTTVTWTVKDASNNIATATQIVTVKDITIPVIKAPSSVIVDTTLNCEATGVVLGTPVTSDNCSIASVTNDAPTAFPIGNTTVTWTVKDASNNTAKATQIVTVKELDLAITNNSNILSVAEIGAIYKWLTCDNGTFTAIPNETKSTFKPIKNGSYAVEITKNGCTLTSNCFEVKTLGTEDFDAQTSLKLYPNPAKDFVTIEMILTNENKLKVFDINGQTVLSKDLKTNSTIVNISHFAAGVYMFEISNELGSTIKKIIKK
jgi:uncharacterized delta-60 repeat protein